MSARPVIDPAAVAAALRKEKAAALLHTGPLPSEPRAAGIEVVVRWYRREVLDCVALVKALDAVKTLTGVTPDAARKFAELRDEARALIRLRATALRLFGERVRANVLPRAADVTKLPEVAAALAAGEHPACDAKAAAELADALVAGFDELLARFTS